MNRTMSTSLPDEKSRVEANRRRIVVINKQFQYQYAMVSVFASVILINAVMIMSMIFPDARFFGEGVKTIQAYALAAIEILLMFGIWRASILASHRIAGPMFVLERNLKRLGSGDLSFRTRLRKKDAFREVGDAMDENVRKLSDQVVAVKQAANDLAQHMPASDSNRARLDTLLEALAVFKTAREHAGSKTVEDEV